MAIDIDKEELHLFSDVSSYWPVRPTPHLSAVHRWRLHGLRGIRLESIMIGGRRYTSRQAAKRWIESLNEAAAPSASPSHPAPHHTAESRALEALL